MTPETNKNAVLLARLDEWIGDSLENSNPIGITLCAARKRISDQSDRIAELWDAMEILRRERDEARESASRWGKVASAYEVLTPPVGAKRIMKLAHRDGWQCAYCGVETCFTGKEGPKATVDHVVPKSKGGLDHISNCVVACDACNGAKADQEDWSPPEVAEPKLEMPRDDARRNILTMAMKLG